MDGDLDVDPSAAGTIGMRFSGFARTLVSLGANSSISGLEEFGDDKFGQAFAQQYGDSSDIFVNEDEIATGIEDIGDAIAGAGGVVADGDGDAADGPHQAVEGLP